MQKTLSILFLIAISTITSITIFGQRLSTVSIPKDELNKIIAGYRSATPDSLVHDWMKKLPPPATRDASAHPELITMLPSEIAKLRVEDQELENAVTQVLDPILSQYDRSRSYRIIVIRHSVPSILFDSMATLVITTGMLDQVVSDDEFLGAVGHEIGHELSAKRMRELRQQYQTISGSSDSTTALNATLTKLAELEIDCDAFAAITMAAIGRNPGEFAKLLQSIAKAFPDQLATDHPSVQIRVKVITSIVPPDSLQVKPMVTENFLAMKSLAARISKTSQKRN